MQLLTYEIARQRELELRRAKPPRRAHNELPTSVVIRLAGDRDEGALRRLAALEGNDLLPGRWLVAAADGAVTAALHLDERRLLADPFARTVALRRLLELWADQLVGRRRKRRW